ncbi:MAG: DUF3164 family protein [Paludibacter sp.]|nr:DUF3164 family protein [Bacteroidales bacterium]MCM1069846.1 DUF3164 family protein [Prevotella sp.]MCM1353961.1 DUF3164 family protein [Bacteroides sp.]MCM1443397.1 DUF3164 family protein [Muribaculum sp.]MCM1482100.1 DUF3164 family protein [Paludibacter sp.]
MEEKTTIQMTASEAEEFAAFKAAQAQKVAEEKRKADLMAYNTLVDETIQQAMPLLTEVSSAISHTKRIVMEQFRNALTLKSDMLKVKEGQRSHTFTNSQGTQRITLGYYQRDDYRDTVEDGIAMVREAIESMATDEQSRALVQAVLRLLARDQKGTLKASRVLQLQKLADDSNNDRFKEGVRIIRDSYQPTISKQFIRAEVKDANGEWKAVNLGMTEA